MIPDRLSLSAEGPGIAWQREIDVKRWKGDW